MGTRGAGFATTACCTSLDQRILRATQACEQARENKLNQRSRKHNRDRNNEHAQAIPLRSGPELNTPPVWVSMPKTPRRTEMLRTAWFGKQKESCNKDDCMQNWRSTSADPEPGAAAEPLLPEPDAQGLRKPRGAETRNIGTIAQQLDLNQRNTLRI